MSADVVVIGGGLVGLSITRALAARGMRVTVIEAGRPGAASRVGAGMLAPSVEHAGGPAQALLVAARDGYAAAVSALSDETGVTIPVNQSGILEIASDEADASRRRTASGGDAVWCTTDEVRRLDAGYAAPWGAVWHRRDGAVDPVPLLRGLDVSLAQSRVRRIDGLVVSRDPGGVVLASGDRLAAATTVLCAGAWAGTLAGLPRAVPVRPVRGQMLELPVVTTRLVAYGAGGYLVPRADGRTYVGATMEDVGFDAATTDDGGRWLAGVAVALSPALAGQTPARHEAALRPMTPDHLPVLGPDPDDPSLWYACGHGRNGILLAPLTGEVVAAALTGDAPAADWTPFSIARFA